MYKRKRKFIFAIILIFICFFSINVKAETTILYGDVDGNGKIDVSDATALENYLSDKIELSYEAQKRGNVDGDNKITANDSKIIRSYIAGQTTIPIKMGDVNEDGVVDQLDVLQIQKYANESIQFTQKQILIGDVNVDNTTDIYDASLIQQYMVDKVETLPTIDGKEIVEPNNNNNNDNNTTPIESDSKEEPKDDNQVVKVEDTLAKIPLVLGVLSISLILVGGLITSAVLLTKQHN